MSIVTKIRHKTQTSKGKARKAVGRLTGNRRLRNQGRADQFKGNVMQAADKVKDTFKH